MVYKRNKLMVGSGKCSTYWPSGFQLSVLKPMCCRISHGKVKHCQLCDTWHLKGSQDGCRDRLSSCRRSVPAP